MPANTIVTTNLKRFTLIGLLNAVDTSALCLYLGTGDGPWANDALWKDDEEIVGLYLDPRHNNIVYTDFISEDYEEHISEWAEKPVEVLDGWLTLGDFIYSNKKKL